MNKEDKDKIEGILDQMKRAQTGAYAATFSKAIEGLEALIEEERWGPKRYKPCWGVLSDGDVIEEDSVDKYRLAGIEWPTEELAIKASNMIRRNNLILQAKTEMGYEDGEWVICRDNDDGEWMISSCNGCSENPELTFATEEQAKTVLTMIMPYLEEE